MHCHERQGQKWFDYINYDYNYALCNRFSIAIISSCNRRDNNYIPSPKLKTDFVPHLRSRNLAKNVKISFKRW